MVTSRQWQGAGNTCTRSEDRMTYHVRTSDQTVGAQEQLRVQVQAVGHQPQHAQTQLFTAQEEGGLGVTEVGQST